MGFLWELAVVLRWVKRSLWTALLIVLVLLPARLAHSPAQAQASAPTGLTTPRERAMSPVGYVILTMSAAVIPTYLLLRRRARGVSSNIP